MQRGGRLLTRIPLRAGSIEPVLTPYARWRGYQIDGIIVPAEQVDGSMTSTALQLGMVGDVPYYPHARSPFGEPPASWVEKQMKKRPNRSRDDNKRDPFSIEKRKLRRERKRLQQWESSLQQREHQLAIAGERCFCPPSFAKFLSNPTREAEEVETHAITRKQAEQKIEIDLSKMFPLDEINRFGQFASMEYADENFRNIMREMQREQLVSAVVTEKATRQISATQRVQEKTNASKKLMKDFLEANMTIMDTIIAESNDDDKIRAAKIKKQMAAMEEKLTADMSLSGQNTQAAYSNLVQRMQQNSRESKKLQEEIFKRSIKELKPMQDQMKSLNDQQINIATQKSKTEKTIEDIKSQISDIQTASRSQTNQPNNLDILQSKLNSSTKELSNLIISAETISKTKETVANEIKKMTKELGTKFGDISLKQNKLDQDRTEVLQKIDELNSSEKSREEQFNDLKNSLKEILLKSKQIETKDETQSSQNSESNEKLDSILDTLTHLCTQISDGRSASQNNTNANIDDLSSQIQTLNEEIKSLKSEIPEAVIEKFDNKLVNLENLLKKVNTQSDDAPNTIDSSEPKILTSIQDLKNLIQTKSTVLPPEITNLLDLIKRQIPKKDPDSPVDNDEKSGINNIELKGTIEELKLQLESHLAKENEKNTKTSQSQEKISKLTEELKTTLDTFVNRSENTNIQISSSQFSQMVSQVSDLMSIELSKFSTSTHTLLDKKLAEVNIQSKELKNAIDNVNREKAELEKTRDLYNTQLTEINHKFDKFFEDLTKKLPQSLERLIQNSQTHLSSLSDTDKESLKTSVKNVENHMKKIEEFINQNSEKQSQLQDNSILHKLEELTEMHKNLTSLTDNALTDLKALKESVGNENTAKKEESPAVIDILSEIEGHIVRVIESQKTKLIDAETNALKKVIENLNVISTQKNIDSLKTSVAQIAESIHDISERNNELQLKQKELERSSAIIKAENYEMSEQIKKNKIEVLQKECAQRSTFYETYNNALTKQIEEYRTELIGIKKIIGDINNKIFKYYHTIQRGKFQISFSTYPKEVQDFLTEIKNIESIIDELCNKGKITMEQKPVILNTKATYELTDTESLQMYNGFSDPSGTIKKKPNINSSNRQSTSRWTSSFAQKK